MDTAGRRGGSGDGYQSIKNAVSHRLFVIRHGHVDKRRLAERIDKQVTTLLKEGGTDIDIFVGMADYMAEFKWLMDTCSPSDMHRLCTRYVGFFRYAKTLKEIAQGIKDGDIPVP